MPAAMGMIRPPPGVTGPTLDVQVLQGLETYIATEQFLHKLEAASAEWIDLSEHHHAAPGLPHAPGAELELPEVGCGPEGPLPPAAVPTQQAAARAAGSSDPLAAQQCSTSSGSGGGSGGSFFSRWRSPLSSASGRASSGAAAGADGPGAGATSSTPPPEPPGADPTAAAGAAAATVSTNNGTSGEDGLPAVVVAASCLEVVGPQPHLAASLSQEPFVLVSSEDAIEGMAYYIALYLSRAPEARNMEPRQLQAALRQTFTDIRRSRYRAIWDWGRWLYRWGAVSYSALQLYEHPWLVRAVVAGVWASSRMALGFLW